MSDIFREVDEALQREKAEKFWAEYGATILIAAVLIVVGTALGVLWRNWDHSRNEAETARLIEALRSEEQASLQTVIEDGRSGPEAIALMSAAQKAVNNGDIQTAADLYRQAAEDRNVPRDLRDLARISYVRLQPETDANKNLDILKPVLDRNTSPFIWQARLEAARLEAKSENYDVALKQLSFFNNAEGTIPESLLQRASAMRQLYTHKATEKTDD